MQEKKVGKGTKDFDTFDAPKKKVINKPLLISQTKFSVEFRFVRRNFAERSDGCRLLIDVCGYGEP